jgi:glycine cleavage system H protein
MAPNDRKYSASHEWIMVKGDVATVGITDHAQDALGDITYVELPKTGIAVTKGSECCVIESVKAASDVYAPVSGTVSDANNALTSSPEIINQSPYEEGWLFRLNNVDDSGLDDLMDAAAYEKFLEESH